MGPREWPTLNLYSQTGGSPSAQVEILEICPAAKVYRRTATMTQVGIVLGISDRKYPIVRTGTLGWTAIDAHCPAPDGHVRFEAGPFYYVNGLDPDLLTNWSLSYRELRPPAKHPQEWQAPGKSALRSP